MRRRLFADNKKAVFLPNTPIGQFARRLEDQRFLTGSGQYTANLNRDGQAHAVVVRSDHGHAEINAIDVAPAMNLPGVIGVHTYGDLAADGLQPLPCTSEFEAVQPLVVPPRHALAKDRVRHVGDPIAVVIAESHEAALTAAESVEIDLSPLTAVSDSLACQRSDAPLIWDQAPENIAFRFQQGERDATDAAFARADHVVELEIVNNRISAVPMEPRAGIGEYDPEADSFTLTCSAQGLHTIRRQLASGVFNLPEDKFHLIAHDVGGGFGLKNFLYPEWVVLVWAARRHGRPIKWVAERSEEFSSATHGRDIHTRARLGLNADGEFLALSGHLVANMGAYLSAAGPGPSTKAAPTAMGGIYAIPHVFMESVGVFTNTAPVDAYRGAGKPEANFIIERLIDDAARRFGFNPVELRLRNAITSFPHVTSFGNSIDTGRMRLNIEDAVKLSDHAGFEARRRDSAEINRLRGLGVGCFLETARGAPQEGAEIIFNADGSVDLRVGTESNGQGHETTFKQVAAEMLGLPISAFNFVQADTAKTRTGFGHGGARSMHMGGAALVKAINAVLEKAERAAALLLQANENDVSFSDGVFTVSDTAQSVTLSDVAAACTANSTPGLASDSLDSFEMVENAPFTFPNGCHVAEVEVDPDTGDVKVLRYVIVDDYGNLINPQLTEGQVHGGIAQGIGQALGEHAVYDLETSQLMAGSMMDYYIPWAADIPPFETHLNGTPTKANPLGVKGSGQAGCIAAPQTIINAILDALSPLGIDHIDMPATSETIWRAIQSARAV